MIGTLPIDIKSGDLSHLVTSDGDHGRPVQTCLFQDLPIPPTPHRATSGGGN